MSKFKILNCEPDGFDSNARVTLESVGEVVFKKLDRVGLLNEIKSYDGLVLRLGHRIDREILERAPLLKFIATPTTGIDHIDIVEAERRGVAVISLKGESGFLNSVTATAEHAFGLLIALARKVPWAHADVLSGHWQRESFQGHELRGSTLGVVGFGRLGRMMANYGAIFGMTVVTCDPHVDSAVLTAAKVRQVDLHELLKISDVVTLHVPLDESTQELIGEREFVVIKKGALLINTSRGGIVDEAALLKALESKRLGGAALDVLMGENQGRLTGKELWLKNHPLVNYAAKHDNLLLTPHIGGLTLESLAKAERFLAQKIRTHLTGAVKTTP